MINTFLLYKYANYDIILQLILLTIKMHKLKYKICIKYFTKNYSNPRKWTVTNL